MPIKNLRNLIKTGINAAGFDLHRLKPADAPPTHTVSPAFDRIHYACYKTYLEGWLNVDILNSGPDNYMYVNLATRHPFPDAVFAYAFAEDFLEHLDQADSITFLYEAFRTLKPGGVFRLSFPSFQATLREHYTERDFSTLSKAKHDAFEWHGHRHFYSPESLATVTQHIGFDIAYVEAGHSVHAALDGIDTRVNQADSNIFAELTRPA